MEIKKLKVDYPIWILDKETMTQYESYKKQAIQINRDITNEAINMMSKIDHDIKVELSITSPSKFLDGEKHTFSGIMKMENNEYRLEMTQIATKKLEQLCQNIFNQYKQNFQERLEEQKSKFIECLDKTKIIFAGLGTVTGIIIGLLFTLLTLNS